jgi:hypothetical protein
VVGCCEYGDEPSVSGATELAYFWKLQKCILQISRESACSGLAQALLIFDNLSPLLSAFNSRQKQMVFPLASVVVDAYRRTIGYRHAFRVV